MAAVAKFSEDEMGKGDVRKRWRSVVRLMAFFNAFLNFQIITSSGKNALTITESNVTLELNIAASPTAPAPILNPWQPVPSPYVGTGAEPADQGLRMRLRPGVVWDGAQLWMPSNRNAEFLVPANAIDGYFFWLDATVDASGRISALVIDCGPTLPEAVTLTQDGAPPAHAYDLLCYVLSNATAVIDFSNVMRSTPLNLVPVVTDTLDSVTVERRMLFQPPNPEQNF